MDALTLNIKIANYKEKIGTLSIAIIYRIKYKVMSSAFNTRALKTTKKEEIVFFQIDLARFRISISRTMTWMWYHSQMIGCC